MNFNEHVELRNSLYQTSLKLFHCNIEWLSEYIPSVSKWRIKVLLKDNLPKILKEPDYLSPNININNVTISNLSLNNYIGIENPNINNASEDSPINNSPKSKSPDFNDSSFQNEQFLIQVPNSSIIHDSNNLPDSRDPIDLNESNTNYLHSYNSEFILYQNNELDKDTGIELSNLNKKNNQNLKKKKLKDNEINTYNILTGNNQSNQKHNVKNSLISTYGRTLWEYLPLVALLNGCTGIFILLRLSSIMYRFSILSCTISHLITFIFIGIPLSQIEFALRKKGKRYGLLEIMQSLNPKFIGLTILSLLTTIIIFLYACQIISALSIIIYNIPKSKWNVTYQDALVCNKINNLIIRKDNQFKEKSTFTAKELNDAYALCSYSSVCNVIVPIVRNSNILNINEKYKDSRNLDEFIDKNNISPSRFREFIQSSKYNNSTTDSINWCIPSPSKKLRNLIAMEHSNYRKSLFFSLSSQIYNSEKIIESQIFPIKEPLNKMTPNLYAQIIGLSVSFIIIIFSINGVGKLFRLISFLSFLSLITLLLTATIQIVASDFQLNIFMSTIVTQDGVESLLSPSIWYYSINNTLLFFGISFLITMFPLKDLGDENINNYKDKMFSEDEFQNITDIQNDKFKKNDIKLRKHISKLYHSVCNSCIEKQNFHIKKKNNQKNISKQINCEDKIDFLSLKSAVNSSIFFLACIFLSSIVVMISNAALISLSESTNTHLILPFDRDINKSTNLDQDIQTESNFKYNKNEHENHLVNKLFQNNKWLTHQLKIFDDSNEEIFQVFNGDSASIEEISFFKTQLLSWFKWNSFQIKAQSLILGEYVIIYLIIIGIEVSKRIPSGVMIFFVLIIFSYAVCSASICASIISKHISIIFNQWILPYYLNKNRYNEKDKFVENNKKLSYKTSSSINNYSKKKKKSKKSQINKFECFFRLFFHIIYLLFIYIYSRILNYFGINSKNKKKRKIEILTFSMQLSFILLLIIFVFCINIISVFIPRYPLDQENINNKHFQQQLNSNKMTFLDFSENSELSRFNNGELYVAKTVTVLFGSLLDIRLISNTANFMLALTTGLEVTILTWYLYNDIQKKIVGVKAMKLHYIGYITSTVILSIGFLLGTPMIFESCILLSLLFYLIFFFISRSYARKNFDYKNDFVLKRQKYNPTWWLCISNIDILRRKWNSQELVDAGLLSLYSEKILNNNNNFIKVNNYNQIININNKNNDDFEFMQEISNFNLYCNVRSYQPQFLGFWFILAKYFTTILTISTLPLTIINTIYILFFRSDCLEGTISEIVVHDYISKFSRSVANFFDQVSIFQPMQIAIIIFIEFIGILIAIILTFYIYKKHKKIKMANNLGTINKKEISNIEDSQIDINMDNILDDVYESLKVPMCAELYSTKRIEKLGRMPQSLIISFALLENNKNLNKKSEI